MFAAGCEAPELQDLNRATALFMKEPGLMRFEMIYYPPGATVVDWTSTPEGFLRGKS